MSRGIIEDKYTGMTADILRVLVIYDPLTGLFHWSGKDILGNPVSGSGSRNRALGKVAGTVMKNGEGHVRIEFSEFERFGFLKEFLGFAAAIQ